MSGTHWEMKDRERERWRGRILWSVRMGWGKRVAIAKRMSEKSCNIQYVGFDWALNIGSFVFIPRRPTLGDGHKQLRVGQLCTTIGMLSMEVAYRTKMTISPTQTGRDNTIMLKSDHFLKDISPKHIRYHHSNRKTWVFFIQTTKKLLFWIYQCFINEVKKNCDMWRKTCDISWMICEVHEGKLLTPQPAGG